MKRHLVLKTVLGVAIAIATDLLPNNSNVAAAESTVPAAPVASAPAIEIDGKAITEADLPADVRNALFDNRQEAFEKNLNELRQYAVRFALARAKDSKVDPKKLPPIDSLIKGKEPSEAEAKAFFESNKAKLPPGGTFEQFKPDIVRHLTQQSTQSAFKAKLEELEKQGKLKIIALAPEAPVVNFDLSKYPAKGPQDAPVTLVEASDYLCPHCQQEQPAVEAVLKEFAGKIRFVQVNFALRPDGLSGELARGAHCARKQGDEAFWKFHSKAFEMRFEQSPTPDRGKVLDVAKGAGLDAKILEQCLATAEPKAAVEQAVAAMSDVGVHGTPTFFLNGRKLHTDHVSLKDAVRAALDAKGQTH